MVEMELLAMIMTIRWIVTISLLDVLEHYVEMLGMYQEKRI